MSSPIDFSQARFKHLNWKFRIRGFIDGKESLTKEQAVSHFDCALGIWFYSVGKTKYGHISEMQIFEKEHEKLHLLVKEIVVLKEKKSSFVELEKKLKELYLISDTIIDLLNKAEVKINSNADINQPVLIV